MVDKPNFIIVKETPKQAPLQNQLDKKTQAKMMEYIKSNSTKSLKEVIKKFYKNDRKKLVLWRTLSTRY